MKGMVDGILDGADILVVWGLAAACFYTRVFVIQASTIPHDAKGWAGLLAMAASYAGLVMAQEHFRGKNRAARIKNIWRRAVVVIAAGLGPAIGG